MIAALLTHQLTCAVLLLLAASVAWPAHGQLRQGAAVQDGEDNPVGQNQLPGLSGQPAPSLDTVFPDPVEPDTDPATDPAGPALPARPTVEPDQPVRQNLRLQSAREVGLSDSAGQLVPLANQPARAVQGGTSGARNRTGALGLRAGRFLILPTLTASTGFESGGDDTSRISRLETSVEAVSDWSVHALRGQISGTLEQQNGINTPQFTNFNANGELRLDLSRISTIRLRAAYDSQRENSRTSQTQSLINGAFADNPTEQTASLGAELETDLHPVALRLGATLERFSVSGGVLQSGAGVSQKERNNTLAELTIRASLGHSPALSPFVEGSIGSRWYDDLGGATSDRQSMPIALRSGLAFDRSEILNGEFAIGYASENPVSGNLPALQGLTLDAAINWSPTRLTTISALIETTLDPAVSSADAGSVTHLASLGIEHEFSRRWRANARASTSWRRFDPSSRRDQIYQLQLGANYAINQQAELFGTLGYEKVTSTQAEFADDAFTALLGLRLSR